MSSKPSFRRQSVDARKQSLIEATLSCFAAGGPENLSIRAICAEAGVSVGLINHHYKNKDDLIADTYEKVARDHMAAIWDRVEAVPAERPRARLSAYFAASFSPDILDPDLLMIWIYFWRRTGQSEAVRRTHDETHRETLARLARLIAAARKSDDGRADLDTRLAAIGLAALMDGLWLEWSLDPNNFTPADAVRLCEHWADRL